MTDLDAIQIVKKFNEFINSGDVEGLSSMMTEGHTFIDSQGEVVEGKANMIANWKRFFKAYPDYSNTFERFGRIGNTVILHGYSTCSTEPALEGPAIWRAKVIGGQVSEWRVYEDTDENRIQLGMG